MEYFFNPLVGAEVQQELRPQIQQLVVVDWVVLLSLLV